MNKIKDPTIDNIYIFVLKIIEGLLLVAVLIFVALVLDNSTIIVIILSLVFISNSGSYVINTNGDYFLNRMLLVGSVIATFLSFINFI